EAGYIEGRNVTVEYHWLEGQYDRVPALTADLIRRRVAAVAALGNEPAVSAAKAVEGRSRSCSALVSIRLSLAWLRASRGLAATSQAAIFSQMRRGQRNSA